jgi:hypothetical protein
MEVLLKVRFPVLREEMAVTLILIEEMQTATGVTAVLL